MNTENSTQQTTVGLCADHAGFFMKEFIKHLLDSKGIPYKDFGTHSAASCDYPDFAHPLAIAVEKQEVYPGIVCCGSGNGINMVMNKHQQVRSALCWNSLIAKLAREHNDANVLSLPARFITQTEAESIVNVFFSTPFAGGRHQRRIEKIPAY